MDCTVWLVYNPVWKLDQKLLQSSYFSFLLITMFTLSWFPSVWVHGDCMGINRICEGSLGGDICAVVSCLYLELYFHEFKENMASGIAWEPILLSSTAALAECNAWNWIRKVIKSKVRKWSTSTFFKTVASNPMRLASVCVKLSASMSSMPFCWESL